VAELSAPAEKAVAPEIDPNVDPIRVGMLTILNMSEEDAAQLMRARKIAAVQLVKEGAMVKDVEQANDGITAPYTVTYYDNLESMVMALNAGQLDSISISESVADYLLLTNDNLVKPIKVASQGEPSTFEEIMKNSILGEGYSFMMMEDHADLRDEFDQALTAMKEDGTLDKLIKEQITDVMNGKDPVEIELPPIPDAPTIEVAVTGALPPMDYVGPVGMPVGFSTAVLAEISTRINKNISVSVIDSGARASALASGKADVVFWTRTSAMAEQRVQMDEEELANYLNGLTEEELDVIHQMDSIYDISKHAQMDIPEGTIVTQPYFSGSVVPVMQH
jgi:ABC-type amino acid transport substrate-binding protein